MRAQTLLAFSLLLAPLTARAATAPTLSAEMANTTNNLQRAVWACEAGAPAFAKSAGQGTRFFLGTIDPAAARATPLPLALNETRLSGFGQISNNSGWFNISFDCNLRPDLMQAKSFSFAIQSPVKMSDAPPQSHIATMPNADEIPWSADFTATPQLTHGTGKDQDFFASCTSGSTTIQLRLAHSLGWLKPGDHVVTTITDGRNSALYIAELTAAPNIAIPTSDPLWRWLGKGKTLLINIGGEYVYEVSQNGSGQAVTGFLHACR
jgi:hypothetical protein